MKLNELIYENEIIGLIESERLDEISKAALSWGSKAGHSEKDLDIAWKDAEAKVEKSTGKSKESFKREWGLVNTIYMNIVKKYSKGNVNTLKKTMTKKTKTNTSKLSLAQRNAKNSGDEKATETPAAKRRRIKKTKELTATIKDLKSKPSTAARKTRIKKLMDEKKALNA